MKSTWPASTPSDSELDLPLKSDSMTLFLLPCSLNALVICLGLAKFVSPKVCISYTLQNMETRDDQLGPTARLVCANTGLGRSSRRYAPGSRCKSWHGERVERDWGSDMAAKQETMPRGQRDQLARCACHGVAPQLGRAHLGQRYAASALTKPRVGGGRT